MPEMSTRSGSSPATDGARVRHTRYESLMILAGVAPRAPKLQTSDCERLAISMLRAPKPRPWIVRLEMQPRAVPCGETRSKLITAARMSEKRRYAEGLARAGCPLGTGCSKKLYL